MRARHFQSTFFDMSKMPRGHRVVHQTLVSVHAFLWPCVDLGYAERSNQWEFFRVRHSGPRAKASGTLVRPSENDTTDCIGARLVNAI